MNMDEIFDSSERTPFFFDDPKDEAKFVEQIRKADVEILYPNLLKMSQRFKVGDIVETNERSFIEVGGFCSCSPGGNFYSREPIENGLRLCFGWDDIKENRPGYQLKIGQVVIHKKTGVEGVIVENTECWGDQWQVSWPEESDLCKGQFEDDIYPKEGKS